MSWHRISYQKDPWSGRDRSSPPDLTQFFSKLWGRLRKWGSALGGAKKGPRRFPLIAGTVIALLVMLVLLFGIVIVPSGYQAVVLRWGRYLGTYAQGMHWLVPMVESAYVVNVKKIKTWRYHQQVLTQDQNWVSITLTLHYQIVDPKAFLFGMAYPIKSLQQAALSASYQVISHLPLHSLLASGQQTLPNALEKALNKILSHYPSGMIVTDLSLDSLKMPEAIQETFDDAAKARDDKKQLIDQAQSDAKLKQLQAKEQASQLEKAAQADKNQLVLKAQSEQARYLMLLKLYKIDPEFTRLRLYYQALAGILSKTTNVLDDGKGLSVLPLLLPHSQFVSSHTDIGSRLPLPIAPQSDEKKRKATPLALTIKDRYPDRPSYPDGAS